MKPPPGLLGTALIFWGMQTGWISLGLLMALGIESAFWRRARWEFSEAELERIWDLCAVLFGGAIIVYYAAAREHADSAYVFFQWFPFIFYPMILGQTHGNWTGLPVTVFSWFLRRQKKKDQRAPCFHFGYPYLALCLLSASAGNRRDLLFFAGLAGLCGWALWAFRSRRFSAPSWVCCFAVASGLAYLGQAGLAQVQQTLEGKLSAWLSGRTGRGFDADETRTALGSIGFKKQSGRIQLRIRPGAGPFHPLVRQASYDHFRETIWLASGNDYTQIAPESDPTQWFLKLNGSSTQSMTVYASLPRQEGLLSLPTGVARIEDLPVGTLVTNRLGAVRATDAPGLMAYRSYYGSSDTFDSAPDLENDLQIPPREQPALARVLERMNLRGLSAGEKIAAIEGFLKREFSYSLFVPENLYRPDDEGTPLSRFLLQTRRGHCEYFATATVLLLRRAGIPARYATGYSAQEFAKWSGLYVVRARHAHAWALVWHEGRWQDLDTTPGSWAAEESEAASILETISDFGSMLFFRFQKWRWLNEGSGFRDWAPWLLVPLLLALSWRLLLRRRRALPEELGGRSPALAWAGADSEFYLIESFLAARYGERTAGETLRQWIQRILSQEREADAAPGLRVILGMHQRYRFDPSGLLPHEREELRQQARQWLASQRKAGSLRS